MDTANVASLLHEFQRSLSLLVDDQDAPMPLESPTHTCHLVSVPRSTDPRSCPRPPTPPPSRRPPKHVHHLKRPAPTERSDPSKPIQPDNARLRRGRRRDEDENVPRQRARLITPDSDEESARAWMRRPSDTPPKPSGPLRSILRNRHAGGSTPYQRLRPARHAVRWAAAP